MNECFIVNVQSDDHEQVVTVFPDELPLESSLFIDVLVSLYAPLPSWREVAVEYQRQGQELQFRSVLKEIICELDKKAEAWDHFHSAEDFKETAVDIYNTQAADYVNNLKNSEDLVQATVGIVKKADLINNFHPITWMLKGFFEIRQGKDNTRRAEDHFTNILGVAYSKRLPQYTYIGHLGLGITSYCKQNYSKALDHFSKAISVFPQCNSSTRIAFSLCAFNLEYYNRAMAAVERVIDIDPFNTNAFVMLGLLNLHASQRESSKKKEHRKLSFEYFTIALQLDPTCSSAINHVANHYFHTWQPIYGNLDTSLQDFNKVIIGNSHSLILNENDPIRINRNFTTKIMKINYNSDTTVLILRDSPPENVIDHIDDEGDSNGDGLVAVNSNISSYVLVEVKSYGQVETLLHKVIHSSTCAQMKAEGYYLMGRLHHVQGLAQLGLEDYLHALKHSPDFILAIFGAAQLYFALNRFQESESYFNRIIERFADDKDTQAHLILVRSHTKSEIVDFDKVREISIGFPYEADLWLIQGQLRSKRLDYMTSLRCYEMAISCLNKYSNTIPPVLCLNMSVLHQMTESSTLAYTYAREALLSLSLLNNQSNEHENLIDFDEFCCCENDIFYHWSVPLCSVRVEVDSGAPIFHAKGIDGETLNVRNLFHIGQEISLDETIVITVIKYDDRDSCRFYASSCVPEFLVEMSDGRNKLCRKKVSNNNFRHHTILYCFNYARVLEDMGSESAAMEIYLAILERIPTYTDCYVRVSQILWNKRNLEEALKFLACSLQEKSINMDDAYAKLGDFCFTTASGEKTKENYEKYDNDYTLLSLGNMYRANLSSKREEHLKLAYKYYHHVLGRDEMNIYAAIGLGIICAEKKIAEAARTIFSRVRESGHDSSYEIHLNLANIYVSQYRLVDAIHMYQTAIRCVRYIPDLAKETSSIFDCLSAVYLQYGQFDSAVVSLIKSLHLHPVVLHNWFNLALAREENAVSILNRLHRSIIDIQEAMCELKYASIQFSFLSEERSSLVQESGNLRCGKSKSMDHKKFCEENFDKAEKHLFKAVNDAKRDELKRKLQDETHKKIMKEKLQERESETRKDEILRLAIREKALKASEKLNTLKGDWSSASRSTDMKLSKRLKDDAYSSDSSNDDEGEIGPEKKRVKQEERLVDEYTKQYFMDIDEALPTVSLKGLEINVGDNKELRELSEEEIVVPKVSRVILDDDDHDYGSNGDGHNT